MTPEEYKRLNEESVDSYLFRLGKNKITYDLNWIQIRDLMNQVTGQNFNESTYRKRFSAFKDGYDFAINHNIGDEEIINELELIKLEAKKEQKKVQSLNIELNKRLRESGRKELLWESIKDSIVRLPTPEFYSENYYPPSKDHAGVLTFGDIHWRKYFKSVNNEYDESIAKERMQNLIYETLNIINQQGFKHIHIINGADSIEGMSLRVSQLQSIQSGFIDQTISFCKFISSWLNELSKHVEITYHHVPSANHSEIRPFNSGRGEYPAEDLEKVIMNYVHDVLENNPKVEVPIYESGLIEMDIMGYNVAAIHGHQLKGKKNAIRDLSMLHRKFYDFLYIAHFHHSGSLTVGEGLTNDIEIIQIPSVMGSDEYSDTLMTGAKAGANFSVYQKGKGRTISYNIQLN
jgi:hypothetical protein